MANLYPQAVHNDPRFQTIDSVGPWEIRSVPFSDPSYTNFLRADCLPIQLWHRPTGLSILTASRRTCGKFEALIPETLQGRTLAGCCQKIKQQRLVAVRCQSYEALTKMLHREFGVRAPDAEVFHTYAQLDRPGPKETSFNAF